MWELTEVSRWDRRAAPVIVTVHSQRKKLKPREVEYLLRVTQLVESLRSLACILSLAPHHLQGCGYARDAWDTPKTPGKPGLGGPREGLAELPSQIVLLMF